MADILISHDHASGTLLTGSVPGDGVYEIAKTHGFTWRRNPGIFIMGSPDKPAQTRKINGLAAALREAGHEVTVEIDDTYRPTAVREAAREERSAERVELLEDRAERADKAADAATAARRRISDHIPFGQPKLPGHHSYRRACRDEARMDTLDQRAHEAAKDADRIAARAQGAADLAAMRKDPRVTMRRLDKLRAEAAGIARNLAGYERNFRNNQGEIYQTETHGAATGEWAEKLTTRAAVIAEEISYWEGLLAELEASGAFVAWGKDDFVKGDKVRARGRWHTVRRVNAKSVSVPWIVGGMVTGEESAHSDTIPWDDVSGRRRDGLQWDTPKGEPWPVELAVKVARWLELDRYATVRPHDDESRTRLAHYEQARRLVHGLPALAADSEVAAFQPDKGDTETRRTLSAAYIDVFDRLQAGERVAHIVDTLTPLRPVEPTWTMPTGDPQRIQVRDLTPAHIIAGVYGRGGLFGGSADTLYRYFAGPVAQVIPHQGDEYSGERFIGWWIVVLADGTRREFRAYDRVAAHHVAPAAEATDPEPAPAAGFGSWGDAHAALIGGGN